MGLYSLSGYSFHPTSTTVFLVARPLRHVLLPPIATLLVPLVRPSSQPVRSCFSPSPSLALLAAHADSPSPCCTEGGEGCSVFLPRPTGSIKTTKCCLSIRCYAHSWSTTLLRHSPGGTGLPTLSLLPLALCLSRFSPSSSILLPPSRRLSTTYHLPFPTCFLFPLPFFFSTLSSSFLSFPFSLSLLLFLLSFFFSSRPFIGRISVFMGVRSAS